jgi:hypothetical protein
MAASDLTAGQDKNTEFLSEIEQLLALIKNRGD